MRKPRKTPLRRLRESRTFNQKQFAKLLGKSQQTVSKYERGDLTPPRDVQDHIATIFGVPRHDVFPDAVSA